MKTSFFQKVTLGFLAIIKFIVNHILAIAAFAVILLLAIPVGFYGMYLYIEPELPSMSEIQEPVYKMPLQVYTNDEYLIAEFGNEMSLPISYEQIPKKMIQAFLAAEDDTFFEHEGISIKGLGRAVTEMISESGQQTGGSTITMQVAKNYFLSSERTFKRKLTELFLARRIEQNLTKEQIMTLYVNKIYLGENAYGVSAAAKRYYSRTLDHLTTAQMAMLAGLPKAPSQSNPIKNPEKAMNRRNWIVGRMLKLGYIDQTEHDTAIKETLNLQLYQTKAEKSYPYLAEWARYELVNQYGKSVMNSGWRVKLTINTKRQDMADNALKKGLVAYGKRHGWHGVDKKLHGKNIKYFKPFDGNWPAKILKVNTKTLEAELNDGRIITIYWSGARKYLSPNRVGYFSSDARKVFEVDDIIRVRATNNAQTSWRVARIPKVQGALAAVDPDSGAIQALAGGFDFHHSKFNRATQGWRQPGSIIKPLVYTLALEKGYRPSSMVSDDQLRVGSWKPKNSDGRYYGKISLRRALYLSRNLVSIRLLQSVGIGEARQFLSQFGLTKEKLPSNLTLALGTGQVLPVQMATAYATFANGGHRVQPYFIDSIYNRDGSLVYLANPARACAKCYNKALGFEVDGEADADNTSKAKDNETQSLETKDSKEKTTKKAKDKAKNKKAKKQKTNIKQPKIDKKDPYSVNAGPETDRLYKFSDIKLAAAQAPRIISPRTAYDMASILRDVVVRGTGKRAQRTGRSDIGGKTGTTNLARDAWFAGFQPTLSAVVWVGYDTPRPLGRREYGGVAALPIWSRFMRQALADTPNQWVTNKNLSDSDKRSSKVVKVDDKGKKTDADDNDYTYKTSFKLPPTAYFIQRSRPKPRYKARSETHKKILPEDDSTATLDMYQPEKNFQFETYKGTNATNDVLTEQPVKPESTASAANTNTAASTAAVAAAKANSAETAKPTPKAQTQAKPAEKQPAKPVVEKPVAPKPAQREKPTQQKTTPQEKPTQEKPPQPKFEEYKPEKPVAKPAAKPAKAPPKQPPEEPVGISTAEAEALLE